MDFLQRVKEAPAIIGFYYFLALGKHGAMYHISGDRSTWRTPSRHAEAAPPTHIQTPSIRPKPLMFLSVFSVYLFVRIPSVRPGSAFRPEALPPSEDNGPPALTVEAPPLLPIIPKAEG